MPGIDITQKTKPKLIPFRVRLFPLTIVFVRSHIPARIIPKINGTAKIQ
jgi:hypothetical protein